MCVVAVNLDCGCGFWRIFIIGTRRQSKEHDKCDENCRKLLWHFHKITPLHFYLINILYIAFGLNATVHFSRSKNKKQKMYWQKQNLVIRCFSNKRRDTEVVITERSWKPSYSHGYRGFESHSLRHFNYKLKFIYKLPWRSTQVGDEAPLLRA